MKNIIDTIILKLVELTGWHVQLSGFEVIQDERMAQLKVKNHTLQKEVLFNVIVRHELRQGDFIKMLEQSKLFCNVIFFAQYIPKPLRHKMRENGINYIENSGNCFMQQETMLVYIDNQKTSTSRVSGKSKLNTDAGMRLIYSILLNPSILNATYRQMAMEAEVALGSIGNFLAALKQSQFLEEKGNKVVITNATKLFDYWASAFGTTQRPNMLIRRMSFLNREELQNWKSNLHPGDSWGGEAAAFILDGYILPETLTLYSSKSTTEIMKNYRMVPDIGGNVVLMNPIFSRREQERIAHPFLIYAELIQDSDSRVLETAKKIKEKYIDPLLNDIHQRNS